MEIQKDKGQEFLLESQISRLAYTRQFKYSTTPSAHSESNIETNFNEFMSKLIMSERQNDTTYLLAEQLVKTESDIDITFEQALEDNEVLFVFNNEKGLNFIAIDLDGDIMISITPFEGEGERIFQDFDRIDPEYSIYKLLSLI